MMSPNPFDHSYATKSLSKTEKTSVDFRGDPEGDINPHPRAMKCPSPGIFEILHFQRSKSTIPPPEPLNSSRKKCLNSTLAKTFLFF